MSSFWDRCTYPMMTGHIIFILLTLGATLLWNLCCLFLSIYMFKFLKIPREKPFDAFIIGVLNCESMFSMITKIVFIIKLQPYVGALQ